MDILCKTHDSLKIGQFICWLTKSFKPNHQHFCWQPNSIVVSICTKPIWFRLFQAEPQSTRKAQRLSRYTLVNGKKSEANQNNHFEEEAVAIVIQPNENGNGNQELEMNL